MNRISIDELIETIRCSTFHMSDEEAKPIIDNYLDSFPELLEIHDREWYYKYC